MLDKNLLRCRLEKMIIVKIKLIEDDNYWIDTIEEEQRHNYTFRWGFWEQMWHTKGGY